MRDRLHALPPAGGRPRPVVVTLWHFTCEHGRRALGKRGLLVAPLPNPLLGGARLIWVTTEAAPDRERTGLTMHSTPCDRMAYRYRVLQPERCTPWLLSPVHAAAPAGRLGRPRIAWRPRALVRDDEADLGRAGAVSEQQQSFFEPATGMVGHAHPDTSIEAALFVAPRTGTLRRKVYDYIKAAGGATDDEIQAALDMDGNTERPCRVELVNAGIVADSGIRRRLDGRPRIVWRAQ